MTEYIKIKSNGFTKRKTLVYRVEKTQEHSILGTCYYGRRVRANNHLQGFGQQKLICTGSQFKFSRYELVTIQD